MDFAFTEEQRMLKDQAHTLLAQRVGDSRRAELADYGEAWDPELYRQFVELGWTGLSVPEELGGAGMGFIEEAVLFEELGYACVPGPFLGTVALALPAAAGADDLVGRIVAGEPAALAWAEPGGPDTLADAASAGTKAEGGNGAWRLSGTKHLVVGGDSASFVLVVATTTEGPALFAVEGSDLNAERLEALDGTRSLARLTLDASPARLVAGVDAFPTFLHAVRPRALAAVALEAVGVGQRALDLARDYSAERKQFGKAIGTYQAVSHQVADTYVEIELARSLAYWAAWCVATDDEQMPAAVAAAKSYAATAALNACERSIQVHGGIGFTWEHVLHRYYKRARWIDSFEGTGTALRAAVADNIIG